MTKRKDPQPETDPQELPPPDAVAEPFVLTDPPEPPPPPPPPPSPPPPPEVIVRRGSFVAPLLGGALAAIGGFALSHFNVLGLAQTDTGLAAQVETLGQQHAAAQDKQAKDLATLADRVAALEAAPAPVAPDLSRLDTLEERLSAIEAMPADGNASTAALTAKVAELEQRLAALPATGADPALQQKLDDALSRLSQAEADATARASEAEAAAKAAARTKALDALDAAVASGQPYATELQAVGDEKLSQALGGTAQSGVPTLAQLQADFPEPARQAIRIARDLSTETGWTDRFVDFLASQTGARPLTPLEGDTPDAILSRAEFALSEGRVADALAELDPLDPKVKAPLDAWIAKAQAHLAATAALQAARGE